MIRELSPTDLAAWQADPDRATPVLVDVREPWEFDVCHIAGSVSLPLAQWPSQIDGLPADRPLVLICHHGVRSFHATAWLQRMGYTDVTNLAGGVAAWATQVDPRMPQY